MDMKHPSEELVQWFGSRIPDPEVSPKGGRPAADKYATLHGIFWILDNGAKWEHLPREYGTKSTVHRWYQTWTHAGVFESILREAGRVIEERDGFKLYECFIDGTFAKARGGGDGIGATKVGKGVKIMLLVDARGLPISVETMAAGPHESKAVQQLFDFMLTSQAPPRVIGDKAYDSDALDSALAERGVELIAPHRENRKPENVTQDRRPMKRHNRRWTVERAIAWIQHLRRLCIRREKSTTRYQGFLHIGCTMLLLKEVLG